MKTLLMTLGHVSAMNIRILGITLVACLGGLLFGYDTAVISGTVASLENRFVIPLGLDTDAASSLLGFMVSSALIGCVIGGIAAGYMSRHLGRRGTLMLASSLFAFSALGSAWPETGMSVLGLGEQQVLNVFICYRILGGIGVGLASMVSPMYIAEISPPNVRGRLVSLNQMAIVGGIMVVYFVNYGIALQGDEIWNLSAGWRYMFASELVPAILFFSLLFLVPESPRWLVSVDKSSEARDILRHLHGLEKAESEMQAIRESLRQKIAPVLTYGFMLILIGILLSAFQQFVGINVVLYYAPEIFRGMGSGTNAAMLQTVIVGIINVSFTLVAIVTVDRWGRKPLMITGAVGMAVAMFGLGLSLYLSMDGMLSLVFMLMYVAAFALSWGPVVWVLLSEIFPNNVRSTAMAIAVATQWICNYLVSWSFPILNNNQYLVSAFNHGFAYWIYGAMSVIAAIIIYMLLPETKGKSLEEMEALWVNK